MSKDNADSPLNEFGQNVYRTVEVANVTFVTNQQQDYYLKLKSLFSSAIPTEAEVRFVMVTHNFDEGNNEHASRENYLAKIKFNFSGADRNAKTGVMNFAVNSYKLYKIK